MSCAGGKDMQRRCLWDKIIIRERPSTNEKKLNALAEYGLYLGKTPLYEFQTVAYEVKAKSQDTCSHMNENMRKTASCQYVVEFLDHLNKLSVVPSRHDKNVLLCKCIDVMPGLVTKFNINCHNDGKEGMQLSLLETESALDKWGGRGGRRSFNNVNAPRFLEKRDQLSSMKKGGRSGGSRSGSSRRSRPSRRRSRPDAKRFRRH